MLHWNLAGKKRRELDNLKDEVEKNISRLLWLVDEDERRSDKEKVILVSEQLGQLLRDIHRMEFMAEEFMAGKDNCLLAGREKGEIQYYN